MTAAALDATEGIKPQPILLAHSGGAGAAAVQRWTDASRTIGNRPSLTGPYRIGAAACGLGGGGGRGGRCLHDADEQKLGVLCLGRAELVEQLVEPRLQATSHRRTTSHRVPRLLHSWRTYVRRTRCCHTVSTPEHRRLSVAVHTRRAVGWVCPQQAGLHS
jgi:hypothetical protein